MTLWFLVCMKIALKGKSKVILLPIKASLCIRLTHIRCTTEKLAKDKQTLAYCVPLSVSNKENVYVQFRHFYRGL